PYVLSLSVTDPRPSETYTLSLHDALPICAKSGRHQGYSKDGDRAADETTKCPVRDRGRKASARNTRLRSIEDLIETDGGVPGERDRKSTRLNSSHSQISYAVFCLKKKKNK